MRWLPRADGDPWLRCELASRGDRLRSRLRLPDGPGAGSGPWPLALVAGALAHELPRADALALAVLDLPFCGERASPKWSERLEACLARGAQGATDRALIEGFLDQARADVSCVLDALSLRAEVDAGRMAFVGVGAGALVGATVCAAETRLRAFVLAPGSLAPSLDPTVALAARAPARRVLLATGVPGDRAAAWARAAGATVEPAGPDPLRAALARLSDEAVGQEVSRG